MKSCIPAILAIVAGPAFAEETRSLDSHEHGVGELNIAVDGNIIGMEFHAPGADIVGFEHEAHSAEDQNAVTDAIAVLSKPQELFVFSPAAKCSVTEVHAELSSEEEHGDHEEQEHKDHDHEDKEHDHEDKEHAHDHEESHADDDAHDDEPSHTEFHAEYLFSCDNPQALTMISFDYFEAFENAREIDVQIVSASGAQAFEVLRQSPTLDISGLF